MNFEKIRDTLQLLGMYEDMEEFGSKVEFSISLLATALDHLDEPEIIKTSLTYAIRELTEIEAELNKYNGIKQD